MNFRFQHYLDLNEPYLQMNNEYFKTGQQDYLSTMGVPETEAPPIPPTYVNGNMSIPISTTDNTAPDYLCMSPLSGNVLFSPRTTKDQDNFNFTAPQSPTIKNNLDSSPQQKLRKKPIPEEIPMLKKANNYSFNSDSESELSPDPVGGKKFSDLNKTNDAASQQYKNIRPDNYVNVPSTIINMNNLKPSKDAFSNPSYVSMGGSKEKNK